MDKFNEKCTKLKIILSVGLALVFFVIGLAFFARPKVSESEKRKLTEFPKFTLESFLSGEYTSQISLWYSDTYPLREGMVNGSFKIKDLYGIRGEQMIGGGNADEIPSGPSDVVFNPTDNGQGEGFEGLYVNGDTAYQLYYFNKQNSDSYIALINEFAASVAGKATVYDMIVPLHCQIALSNQTIEQYNASDCAAAIKYMYGNLSSSVVPVNVLPQLAAHSTEYLYFRTDHHWTARGAYYAYVAFCNQKSISPTPLNKYQRLQFDGFLGTYYENSMFPAMKQNPDYVEAFVPIGTNIAVLYDEQSKIVDSDYRVVFTKASSSNKYICFLGGDKPLMKIHNPNISNGSSIVVIKESYGNAFVPFLVDSYEYVYVIDYRDWIGNLTNFVVTNGIKDVLFLNVINNTSVSDRITELSKIIK